MRLKRFLAGAVVALSWPAFAQQFKAPKTEVEFGDPADARHDSGPGQAGRRQQAG